MSADHKEALAIGRNESRAVKAYLVALDSAKPTRGRQPKPVAERLAAVEAKLADPATTPLEKLNLRQEKLDLSIEAGTVAEADMLPKLERAFIAAAKGYGARKGITYGVWRQSGVPADVLKKAGISR